jgi:hypothetical protein
VAVDNPDWENIKNIPCGSEPVKYSVSISLFLLGMDMGVLTWSTTWCAMRPLFCRILKSVAPLARAIFFATGYIGYIMLAD